jgi:hypothetical protein
MFHLILKFLAFIHNESYHEASCSFTILYKLQPTSGQVNVEFKYAYTPVHDRSVDESSFKKGCLSIEMSLIWYKII